MALDPSALPEDVLEFLLERHLATLTTLRPDGTPHVVPVGFTFDAGSGLVRVITSSASRKARNVVDAAGHVVRGRAVVSQVDRGRWLSLEGPAAVSSEPDRVLEAERRYAQRYRVPSANPLRVALEIRVDRVLGRG